AEHTRNIKADGRVSLLFENTAGLDDPLTGARVTLQGHAELCDEASARARYLARHPAAAGYADFGDVNFYRVTVARAHLVAGFGLIDWIDGDALRADAPALVAAEADIVAHMNADHADAIALYAAELLGQDGEGWTMTGIDPLGIDLRAGGRIARLDFSAPVADPDGARAALRNLAEAARETQRQAS
ncbi:MAG: DUF2470 domain-containing protein, partial [Alphaproteobacteria bacterium]|nr:DUF2470 domain-containing protein [Alphaproteobacteria bacterium]